MTDDDYMTVDAQTTGTVHPTIAPAQERVARSLAQAVTEAVRVVALPPKERELQPVPC